MIQADFLLTAGRESVISTGWDNTALEGVGSLGWNEKVLEGVFRTFIWKAVPRFNRTHLSGSHDHSLRYTWPLFLKDSGGTDHFWSKLKRWIFMRLKTEAVLESRQQGKLAPPESLFYIPAEYRLNGNPLVEDERSRHRHLSFFYDTEIANTLPQLKEMGVKVLKFPEFLKELKDIINKLGDSFLSAQTKEWHSQIAGLFPRYSNTRQVANIPLIPLRDGRWVIPSQSHLFLEGEATNAEVPNGLDICIVDHEACQDKRRMEFFAWIGIKRCNQAEVCQMIVESYKPFRARTLANSVQDLIYLFQTPRLVYNKPIENLQVLGAGKHSSGFMHARRLYIEHPDTESIVSKYSGNPASSMPTLNPAYIEAARALGKETEFVSWVCSRLNMSLLPRLADEQGLPSPEFNFLKTHAIEDLLLLLRDNWDHYAGHFTHKGRPSRLKTAISEMSVPCMNGISHRLDVTVLPRDPLKLSGPHLIFINVPDPNDTRWLKFSALGVLTNRSTEFYLRELRALLAQPEADNTSKSTVEKIYQELGLCKNPEIVQ